MTALLELVVPAWYHPGDVLISILIGTLVALCLVLVARERGRARAAAIDHTGSIAALRRKPWPEFEIAVGEAIRRRGYLVRQRGGFERDRGTDLIAERGDQRVLVQCKHWLRWKVHEEQVKILFADVTTQGFTEGWLVTCGRFTDYAVTWANGRPIRLIDGDDLVELIGSVTTAYQSKASQGAGDDATQRTCPNCGSRLGRLTNRYDHSKFWGCSNSMCGWTFDDPPAHHVSARCGRGHAMELARTGSDGAYWKCSIEQCSRKRLVQFSSDIR